MSTVAIIGAGPLGGALASALAGRARVGEVRLIDPEGRVAEGKALDILQSSPVDGVQHARHRHDRAMPPRRAATSSCLRIRCREERSPASRGWPWCARSRGWRATSPFLFAGGGQRELMGRSIAELRLPSRRLLGSAPLGLESAVRAVTAALMDASPADLSIGVAGVPPRDAVIGWDAATAFNRPIAEVLAPHHLSSLTSRLPALWPPPALHARERRRPRRRGARRRLAPSLHVLRRDRRHRRGPRY